MHIQASIDVNCPTPEAFRYLIDPTALVKWQTFLVSAEPLTSDEVGVGSKFRNKMMHPDFGQFGAIEVIGEVILFEPNKRIKISGHSKIGNLIIDYQLHAIEGGTRLVQTADFKVKGLLIRPIIGLMAGFLSEQFEADLKNFKRLIESQ